MYDLVKKAVRRPHAFMGHGTRWLPGAKIAGTRKTANITPPAQEAKEPAGKMPEVALRDAGANLNKAIGVAHVGERRIRQKIGAAGARPLCGKPGQPGQEGVSRTLWGGGRGSGLRGSTRARTAGR